MFGKALRSGLGSLVRSFHSAKLIRDHNRFGIIGVPFAKGQQRAGVDLGPSAIRAGGLVGHLKEIADYVDVRDYGDVEYTAKNEVIAVQNMLALNAVSECNYELSRKVHRILSDGRMVITLGGDHAIGIGSVDGHYRYNPNVAVIWVDAHADLNTNATSLSGNIHGMPVALLAKELTDYWPYLPGMDWQKPNIPINNFGYIGLRSVDDFERAIIERYEIAAYGMREIDHLGIVKVVQNVLQRIDPENKKSIHLSFDIDALDSLEAPSTGTSVRGGMSLREGILLVEQVFLTGRLNAMDLVEVNPGIGDGEDVARTVNAANQLIKAACGFDRLGKLPAKDISKWRSEE